MKRDQFQGNTGPVHQLLLVGIGFTYTVRTQLADEANRWPAPGSYVDLSADAEQTKDGLFRLQNVVLEVVPFAAAKPAAGRATAPAA